MAAWKGEEEIVEMIVEFYKGLFPASFKTLIITPAALHFLQHFSFAGSWWGTIPGTKSLHTGQAIIHVSSVVPVLPQ